MPQSELRLGSGGIRNGFSLRLREHPRQLRRLLQHFAPRLPNSDAFRHSMCAVALRSSMPIGGRKGWGGKEKTKRNPIASYFGPWVRLTRRGTGWLGGRWYGVLARVENRRFVPVEIAIRLLGLFALELGPAKGRSADVEPPPGRFPLPPKAPLYQASSAAAPGSSRRRLLLWAVFCC